MLTYLLSRAVPNVYVSYAVITDSFGVAGYFILVDPEHTEYWTWFKRRYPHCVSLAQDRGANVNAACPEFPTQKGLLDWLSDTLGLSQGERNLLRLCRRM